MRPKHVKGVWVTCGNRDVPRLTIWSHNNVQNEEAWPKFAVRRQYRPRRASIPAGRLGRVRALPPLRAFVSSVTRERPKFHGPTTRRRFAPTAQDVPMGASARCPMWGRRSWEPARTRAPDVARFDGANRQAVSSPSAASSRGSRSIAHSDRRRIERARIDSKRGSHFRSACRYTGSREFATSRAPGRRQATRAE